MSEKGIIIQLSQSTWEAKIVYEMSVTLQFEAYDWDDAWNKAITKLKNDDLDGKEPVPDQVHIEYLINVIHKEYVQ